MVRFHRQRQLSHERETDTLWRGGTYRPLIIWMQKSFDPDRI